MKIFRWILILIVLLVAAYIIWGYTGKDYNQLPVPSVPINIVTDSTANGQGNLTGIQPFLTASDYCDQQHFHDALHIYFKKAQAAGLLQPKTVVVLPENIGTWLAFAGEKSEIYQADSMRQAVATIVNSNIFTFIRNLLSTPADDKIKHAFMYMKAAQMIRIYTAVFSSLAKEFRVTIAAGSIILPQPSVDAKGRIRFTKGQLYYSYFFFDPDGRIQAQPLFKLLPEYNSKRAGSRYTEVQTPAGLVGVATGIEAENSSSGSKAKAKIFFNGTDPVWDIVWKGANGFSIPLSAIRQADDTSSSRSPLVGKQSSSGNRTKIVVENGFTASLWEISYRNKLFILQPDTLRVFAPIQRQGRIVNRWLR